MDALVSTQRLSAYAFHTHKNEASIHTFIFVSFSEECKLYAVVSNTKWFVCLVTHVRVWRKRECVFLGEERVHTLHPLKQHCPDGMCVCAPFPTARLSITALTSSPFNFTWTSGKLCKQANSETNENAIISFHTAQNMQSIIIYTSIMHNKCSFLHTYTLNWRDADLWTQTLGSVAVLAGGVVD